MYFLSKKKSWFTLIELIVVIGILVILIWFSANFYSRTSKKQSFEIALENIYSNIDNKKIETVISNNKISKIFFNKNFNWWYYYYTENALDSTDIVLWFSSWSIDKDTIIPHFSVSWDSLTGSLSLDLVKEEISWDKKSFPININNWIITTDTSDFLNIVLSDLDKYTFYLQSNGNNRSWKISFSLNWKNSSIYLNIIEAKDFQNNSSKYDGMEISFTNKWKKTYTGILGNKSYLISSFKLIYNDSQNDSYYINLN